MPVETAALKNAVNLTKTAIFTVKAGQ